MTTSKTPRVDAQRNRQALLIKAREIFDAGDAEIPFDDFARRAGVGIGTLYRHFPTRGELALAVYHEEIALLCARANQLRAALSGAEALAAFLRGMIDYMDSHRGLARALAKLMSNQSAARAEPSAILEEAVTGLMADAVDQGTIRSDVSAGAVMTAMHGIGAGLDSPSWRPRAEEVITLILDGLRQSRSRGNSSGTKRATRPRVPTKPNPRP
jgi:AcrR family transcriptional regulator